MTQPTRFPTLALTVISACLLAACGSGGGKAPAAAPTPTPKTEAPKTEQATPQVKQQAETPKTATLANPPKTAQPPANNPADTPKVSAPKTEQTAPQAKQQAETPKAATPAEPPKAEQPQTTVPAPTQPPVNNPPADTPKVPAPQAETPEVAPQPPAPPAPVETDRDVFQRLSLENRYGVVDASVLRMVLPDNGHIDVELVQAKDSFLGKQIDTLRDSNGKLIGYYGYAALNLPQKNDYDGSYDSAQSEYHHLQHADSSLMRRPVADSDINYRGHMYYNYASHPADFLQADVSATYHGRDKTMSMMMHDQSGGMWTLHQDRSPRSSERVAVDERGSVGGHLFFHAQSGGRPTINGHFNGGFYGTNGSVLTGRAAHEGSNAWQGVVGATAQ